MMVSRSTFTLLVVAALAASSAYAQDGSFTLTCQEPGNLLSNAACNGDCNWNHNSSVGACDSNHNCICNNDGLGTGFGLGLPVPPLHCVSQENSAVIAVHERACDLDCLCVHGGSDGVCDWGHKQCMCVYPPGFVSAGVNQPACVVISTYNLATCLVGAVLTNQVPPGCGA